LFLHFQFLTNGLDESYSAPQFDGAGSTHGEAQHDHGPHWTHIHRGSISDTSGLEPAQKLDPILDPRSMPTSCCPHNINLDSDSAPRAGPYSDSESAPTHQCDVLNNLDPRVTSKHGASRRRIPHWLEVANCPTFHADAPTTSYPDYPSRSASFQLPPRRGTGSNVDAGTTVEDETQPSASSKSDDELHRQVPRVDPISHVPRNFSPHSSMLSMLC
jgi:hypothetical protein